MSPAKSDSLLGTKPESLLGTTPSKLSRQTGGSHSVLVHSVNEDGTTQVGCLGLMLGFVLDIYSRLEAACVFVLAALCMLWWGGRDCCRCVSPAGDHSSVKIVTEQICCRPESRGIVPLGRRLCLMFLDVISCRWLGALRPVC